mgnify:FL=1
MIYQIEAVKTKRKRLVVIYIIVLLLVLLASIGLGIFAAKKVNENKQNENYNIISSENNTKNIISNLESSSNVNINQNTSNTEIKEDIKNNQSKEKFVENVDDIYNGEEGKRVFLTFDDGPSISVTPHILDTLKKYNIKATFFVLGNRVSDNAELIKREYNEGHYIANHGYSHRYDKIYASSKNVLKEYNKTEQEIKKALGDENYSSNLFRFPGGSIGGEYDKIKEKAKIDLKRNQIAYLDWNALTNDAAGAYTKEKIIKNLKKTVGNKNNVVVLMHDAPDKILTYETLEDIIKYLQEKGYSFKNMYDLM